MIIYKIKPRTDVHKWKSCSVNNFSARQTIWSAINLTSPKVLRQIDMISLYNNCQLKTYKLSHAQYHNRYIRFLSEKSFRQVQNFKRDFNDVWLNCSLIYSETEVCRPVFIVFSCQKFLFKHKNKVRLVTIIFTQVNRWVI